jgi:hypothetical protein
MLESVRETIDSRATFSIRNFREEEGNEHKIVLPRQAPGSLEDPELFREDTKEMQISIDIRNLFKK